MNEEIGSEPRPMESGELMDAYPLKHTAEVLNDRLGLYLSPEQRRGFATGMLVGAAVAGALVAWNLTSMLRKRI